MYEFEKPFVVDSSKFERTLGVVTTPIEDAIKVAIAWYRAHLKD
jgi:nucleoside-diphosphate-sugar epimerase